MQEMAARQLNTESTTVQMLRDKNRELAHSLRELKKAQAQLIEKEKMEYELSVARRIQESMLPKSLPQLPGWDLAAYWRPARAVSGDFYDFLSFPDGKVGLVIGDVTSKGVPASLIMAITRSVLRAAAHNHFTPDDLLARVNDLLCPDMPPNMFVTCQIAIFDPQTGELQLANAGHPLPFWRQADGLSAVRATGMPLGLMPGMNYSGPSIRLAPGDRLLFYSDGLIEAHNAQQEMLGVPRVQEYLSGLQPEDASSDTMIQRMLSFWTDFSGPDSEQEDDMTLVALRRLPKS
jgi:serine phosphatase RsbU (regulator of sigma subunit)